jgi:ABC-type nitrate/sulfonate/bicarbonate transport system ATPase subunit
VTPDVIGFDRVRLAYPAAGGPVLALDGVTLDARPGEFLVVVGPSGCGKSTLLKLVAGLLAPTGGEVRVNGARVTGPGAQVGVVFQSALLMPWRSVLDNIMLQIEVRGLRRAVCSDNQDAAAYPDCRATAPTISTPPTRCSTSSASRSSPIASRMNSPAACSSASAYAAR